MTHGCQTGQKSLVDAVSGNLSNHQMRARQTFVAQRTADSGGIPWLTVGRPTILKSRPPVLCTTGSKVFLRSWRKQIVGPRLVCQFDTYPPQAMSGSSQLRNEGHLFARLPMPKSWNVHSEASTRNATSWKFGLWDNLAILCNYRTKCSYHNDKLTQ